jgi:ABC-type branched-subunit amino acid transport system permease subunit
MATLISRTLLSPERDARRLVVKWVVALLIPLLIFTFVWNGEAAVNQILLGFFARNSTIGSLYDIPTLVGATIFFALFYVALTAFVGYAVAADSGKQKPFLLWISMLVFTVVPIVLISVADDLFVGLSFSVLVWLPYFLIVWLWRRSHPVPPAPPLERLGPLNSEQQENLMRRAIAGGFWFGTSFAAVALVIDLIYFFTGSYGALGDFILIWIIVRTVLFPIIGYFLGRLGGRIALRHVLKANGKNGNGQVAQAAPQGRGRRANFSPLAGLSTMRAREEARDLVPNDAPLRSTGARTFYLVLLFAFLLLYPMLDPFLFGQGTDGRLASYGDAGRYVILALGLNIVVGFAGLLDLGYVAFFVFGAYTWAMVGSPQLTVLTGLALNPTLVSWLFWPMLLVAALVAALWGVLLGAPTLRLRGDYLAIVTLGFGEIIPIIAQNMDKYTGGTNGLTGINSPAFFGVQWSVATPEPYYYLMLFLIALVLLANFRLRDSRLGRAWIAIREDEIAAASSGINLVKTKLFAFGAGAFFSGIAGAYYSAKLSTVASSNFSFSDSVLFLAMVVLGGLGSIPGVVVGALAVYAINVLVLAGLDNIGNDPTTFLHPFYAQMQTILPNFTFGNIRNLIFGIILIALMIFRPEGLIPSARRRRELRETQDEEVEADALDVIPGAPGFEEEVRVE